MLKQVELDELYDSMLPSLEHLQTQRVAAMSSSRRTISMLLVLAMVSGVVVAVVVSGVNGRVDLRVLLGFVAATVAWGILGSLIYHLTAGKRIAAYRLAYKNVVIGRLLERLQPEVHYDPKAGTQRKTFKNSQLFHERADRYHAEDGFCGKVGKTELKFSEVRASERRKRGKRTTYVQFFSGLFFEADFHKDFRCSLFVMPDVAESAFGVLGKKMQGFRPFSKHKLVYTEDPEFEKHFVVYGTDQVDARYVLSTSMLQRIVELKRRWKSEIRLRFQGSVVQVAIPAGGDLFEPNQRESALLKSRIESLANELAFCFSVVEDLNLNTRIWTKD